MSLKYYVSSGQNSDTDLEQLHAYRLAGFYPYDENEPLSVTRARNTSLAWIKTIQHLNECNITACVPYAAHIAIRQITRGS